MKVIKIGEYKEPQLVRDVKGHWWSGEYYERRRGSYGTTRVLKRINDRKERDKLKEIEERWMK